MGAFLHSGYFLRIYTNCSMNKTQIFEKGNVMVVKKNLEVVIDVFEIPRSVATFFKFLFWAQLQHLLLSKVPGQHVKLPDKSRLL